MFGLNAVKAGTDAPHLLAELAAHMRLPPSSAADPLCVIQNAFEQFFPLHQHPVSSSPSHAGPLRPLQQDEELEKHLEPVGLSAHLSYCIVLLHISLIRTVVEYAGKSFPTLGAISCMDAATRRSSLILLDPGRREGKTELNSAARAGFAVQRSYSARGNLREVLVWEDGSRPLLTEVAALQQLLQVLKAAGASSCGPAGGVLLIAARRDKSLGVLVAALARHDLLMEFRSIVKGFGTLEDLAALEEGSRGPGLEAYKDFYEEKILSSRVDEVPGLLCEIFDRMTIGIESVELMQRWIHPFHSSYVDSLLICSGILELQEDYQDVFVVEPLTLQPDTAGQLVVSLPHALNGSIGQDFFVFCYGAARCVTNPQWLSEGHTLTITVRNVSCSQPVAWDRNEKLGIASRRNWFPFGEALDCQLFDRSAVDENDDSDDDVSSRQIECQPLPRALCRLPCAPAGQSSSAAATEDLQLDPQRAEVKRCLPVARELKQASAHFHREQESGLRENTADSSSHRQSDPVMNQRLQWVVVLGPQPAIFYLHLLAGTSWSLSTKAM